MHDALCGSVFAVGTFESCGLYRYARSSDYRAECLIRVYLDGLEEKGHWVNKTRFPGSSFLIYP